MNRKFICILTICITLTILTACKSNISVEKNNSNNIENSIEQTKEPIEISINAFGDLLIHDTVYMAAKSNEGYDFTNHFIDIQDKIKNADITIGNLEVPIGLKDFSNYPSFRAPSQLANALKDTLDVEILSTASNHSLDKGFLGLKETLDCLDNVGIKHVGTARTQNESDTILIQDVKGVKVAFLSYTYGTNGYPIPKDAPYCINIIDTEKIVEDSKKAKELGADFVVAKLHNGIEYQLNENSEQEILLKELVEKSEIDLYICDHPHVVQNIKKVSAIKDGKEKESIVIYSLGNFISDQRNEYTDTGIIAKANIVIDIENPDNTHVKNIEYTPIFVDRNPSSSIKKYRVVDINEAIFNYENGTDNLISTAEYNRMIKYRDYYRNKLLQDDFVIEN